MHLHFERTCSSRTDCAVLSLTWMGKVPDELPEEDGWRLNRVNYYQDGWLASGNARGIVGVTFTTCHCRKTAEHPVRTNYNLRGHRSEVSCTAWSRQGNSQLTAACRLSSVIAVWVRREASSKIEFEDRLRQMDEGRWARRGALAPLCRQDNIRVGRFSLRTCWVSLLSCGETLNARWVLSLCAQVLFGTSNGQILVSDMHGEVVAQVTLVEDTAIVAMAWSCEKFKMEEADEEQRSEAVPPTQVGAARDRYAARGPRQAAACFGVSQDLGALQLATLMGLQFLTHIEEELSAVISVANDRFRRGRTIEVKAIPAQKPSENTRNAYRRKERLSGFPAIHQCVCLRGPVTAMTWGHNDKRLFVATGSVIHIGWVTRRIASLQLLSRLTLHRALRHEDTVHKLPLPRRLRALVANLFGQTVYHRLPQCYLPEANQLREFVSRPHTVRLHCTMVRHDTEDLVTGSATYTLFLEYLGGLVPLLKGKRASKLRPEFVIYDPQQPQPKRLQSPAGSGGDATPAASDSDVDEGCASSPGRRRRLRMAEPSGAATSSSGRTSSGRASSGGGAPGGGRKELFYTDELPEREKIVAVTSNLWGTKFKVVGLACWLPPILGMVTYRTSLLHLQPRQMTLVIKELQGPQPGRSAALVLHNGGSSGQSFSEDDDDDMCDPVTGEESAPIAPMTPKKRCGLRCRDPAALLDTETGQADAGPSEEYLTLETTAQAGVQVLSLRQMGQAAPQGTIMSVATQTAVGHAPAQVSELSKELPGPSAVAFSRDDDDESATSPSKRPQNFQEFTRDRTNDPSVASQTRYRLGNGGLGNGAAILPSLGCLDVCLCQGKGNTTSSVASACRSKHIKKPCGVKWHQSIGKSSSLAPGDINTHSRRECSAAPHRSTATATAGSASAVSEPRVRHLLDPVPRWADKAGELKYIDEEPDEGVVGDVASVLLLSHHRNRSSIGPPNADFLRGDPRSRGCDARRLTLRSGAPPRTSPEDAQGPTTATANTRASEEPACVCEAAQSASPAAARKQRFADENPFVCTGYPRPPVPAATAGPSEDEQSGSRTTSPASRDSTPSQSPSRMSVRLCEHRGSLPASAAEETSSERSCPPSPALSRSIPSSPVSGRKSRQQQLRTLLYSPLLLRKARGGRQHQRAAVDSSDEEAAQSGEELLSDGFRDLESMQKAYIRKKVSFTVSGPLGSVKPPPMYKEFILHNKAPLWNEVSQVYQLDFGGRVTQESAKNFQIEFKGNQVMQFGRIDGNAYTLDFQYPFSALQAFAVALANVTQRLK
ncbi:unnamed protein product [Ixodes hexagonus]